LVLGLSPRIAAFTTTIPHDLHQKYVVDTAISRRGKLGKLKPIQKLPFYIAFSHLVPTVHALHYHQGFRDRVDFIFDGDKTDKGLRDCIAVYDAIKDDFKDEPWYPLMGEIIPGDDKELPPLQVADMFAGHLRLSIMSGRAEGAIKLWEENGVKIACQYVGQDKLEKWAQGQNEESVTKILTRIKEERENPRPPVMSTRRIKNKKR